MKATKLFVSSALSMALVLPLTHAENKKPAIELGVGTLGYTANVTKPFSPKFNMRFGANYYSITDSLSESDIDYDAKLRSKSYQALADWYPYRGRFRLTGGLMYNGNQFSMTARPKTTGTYNINGTDYSSTDITSLTAEIDFSKAAPYVGIGFGNPVAGNKRWGITTDLGVMAQGKPNVNLKAVCTNAALCNAFATDLEAERASLQSDLSDFKWYPVASVALTYRF